MPTMLRAHLATLASDALAASKRGGDVDAVLRSLVERVPFATLIADDHGQYMITNSLASSLTGYSTAELRHLSVWQLTPSGSYHYAETLWRAFLARGEQSGAYDIVTKGGQLLMVNYAARARVLPGRHVSLLRPAASSFAQPLGTTAQSESLEHDH